MQTRQRPRVNYAEKDDGSIINTSEEKEYNSESTETDGPIFSQDRRFITDGDSSSVDPDAPFIVRRAPVSTQYSASSNYSAYSANSSHYSEPSDNSDVTFIEKRKTEKK